MLWLQQWPHNRPSSNGPFAFRWKEWNEVIWTRGPNGGAAVKHLTIKQLNCGAAVSLSGKLIQRAVRMIPFIRNKKKKSLALSRSIYIPSQSDTLSSMSPIKLSRENEKSVGWVLRPAMKKNVHICPCIVFSYCVRWFDLPILHRGQSSGIGLHFFCCVFLRFTLLLPCSRRPNPKRPQLTWQTGLDRISSYRLASLTKSRSPRSRRHSGMMFNTSHVSTTDCTLVCVFFFNA